MLADELPVADHHTAKVLRPGAVQSAVDHHVPDPLRSQFQRLWWEAQESIDLPRGEELYGLVWGMRDPGDVLLGIQSHIGGHTGEEDIVGGAQVGDGHSLPLQVADGADLCGPE